MKSGNSTDSNSEINKLLKIMSKLRSPKNGCPWDLVQTHRSLIPYLIEETYEVIDAIQYGTAINLQEELGDLLFQIIFHCQIAKEEGNFCLEDVAKDINKKLTVRHPHVFKNDQRITLKEAKESWEHIKNNEDIPTNTSQPISDRLKKKIRSQPAIQTAIKISNKAANSGFEWENSDEIWEKLNEELEELKLALYENNLPNAEGEIGDVIFTIINIARWHGLNPEQGLNKTNKNFIDRFAYIESSIYGKFSDYDLHGLRKLWQKAKVALQNSTKDKPENSK